MPKTQKAPQVAHGLPLGPVVKDILRIAYRSRLPALLEGPTGIGKSQLVAELANDLRIEHIVLDLSLLEPPDLVGLPVMSSGRTDYAPPAILPTSGAGILLLEELNRAERFIQQPALQLLTARKLHTYTLPDGWVSFAAINPEDGEYQVTPLDPALRARFLNLRVKADREAWISWAMRSGIHPAVIALAKRDPHFMDTVPPRTWAYASQIVSGMVPKELANRNLLSAVLAGYLPHSWVQMLVEEIHNNTTFHGIDVMQLVAKYHTEPALRARVQNLKADGQTDELEMLAYQVNELVAGPRLNELISERQFDLAAFETLLSDLPGDYRDALRSSIGTNTGGWALLSAKAADILAGKYPSTSLSREVEVWASDPYRAHRIAWLIGMLLQEIPKDIRLAELKSNRGTRLALAKFMSAIGERGKPLRELLDSHHISLST